MVDPGIPGLDPQPTLCAGLVEAAASSLRHLAKRKGLALRVDAPELDLVLRVDRRAISQIVLELLHRAIEHTERGSVRISVLRGMREGRGTIEIGVADTGAAPDLGAARELAVALGGVIVLSSEHSPGGSATLVLPER